MKKLLLHTTLFILLLSACVERPVDISGMDDVETKAVMEQVAQHIGLQTEGLVASYLDGTAGIGPNSFLQPEIVPGMQPDSALRGSMSNLKISYNPITGVHSVEFKRLFTAADFSNQLQANLEYVYRDKQGRHMAFPRRNRDSLEMIRYLGVKTGETITSASRQGFIRTDSMIFSGFRRQENAVTVKGIQRARGFFESSLKEEALFRYYSAEYRFQQVQIRRMAVQQRDFTQALSGDIDFRFYSKKLNGTDTVTVSYNGNIELLGDGKALIRSRAFREPLLIDLKFGKLLPHRGRHGRP